eukprot:6174636-Pleurochrysis_carterae.AAC.1
MSRCFALPRGNRRWDPGFRAERTGRSLSPGQEQEVRYDRNDASSHKTWSDGSKDRDGMRSENYAEHESYH